MELKRSRRLSIKKALFREEKRAGLQWYFWTSCLLRVFFTRIRCGVNTRYIGNGSGQLPHVWHAMRLWSDDPSQYPTADAALGQASLISLRAVLVMICLCGGGRGVARDITTVSYSVVMGRIMILVANWNGIIP